MNNNITDLDDISLNIKNLYLGDARPWIIGLSGGKDSTCITQLIYDVLLNLPPEERRKEVHVVSSNTLVESPFIDALIKEKLNKIRNSAKKDKLPITVEQLKPELNDTFWVNLIGRGYPSPNKWFRWCTDRLKIRPTTKYVLNQVKQNGEVIIVLGARKSESETRAQTMGKYEIADFKLRKHQTISSAYVYTPIEDLEVGEVWDYLLQVPSPWGDNNQELQALYRKADKEIAFTFDKSTPAGGDSRFGCWVCTVVRRDRSVEGLIEDGETWLEPLLEFRNWLKKIRDDPAFREGVRKNDRKRKILAEKMGGDFALPEHRGHKILGPFTFEARHEMLRRLIQLQEKVSDKKIPLISPEEIKAIETIWIYEGDTISSIADVLKSAPAEGSVNGVMLLDRVMNGSDHLSRICEKNGISSDLVEQLMAVEKDFSSLSRRIGIYNRLEKVIDEYFMREYCN